MGIVRPPWRSLALEGCVQFNTEIQFASPISTFYI